MEKEKHLLYFLLFIVCYINSFLILSGHAIESPQYTVVHSASDFEIRLYRESFWMSALVRGTSFEKSTKEGFHRLYQYIHGANLNSTRLLMTAPVLTSVAPSTSGSVYFVRYYLSAKFEGTPPQAYPELDLQFDKWISHCIAVRKFSGFAKNDTIKNEIKALVTSLDSLVAGKTEILEVKNSYTIAQYNASHHVSGRLNEVWMNVSGVAAEGCRSDRV